DQVERLTKGKISATDFDYDFLRFKAGRFGRDVLARLAKSGAGHDADQVIKLALAAQKREEPLAYETPPLSAVNLQAQITLHPQVPALREEFPKTARTKATNLPACIPSQGAACDGFLLDIDGDGTNELVLVDYGATVFKPQPDGTWARAGDLGMLCTSVADA